MKFTIDTQSLKTAIDMVGHASTSSNASPILENILIDVQKDKVVFIANNTELAIEQSVNSKVEIESEGAFTISNRFISSYAGLQNSDKVTIEHISNGSLRFTTATSKTEVKGLEAKKFPPLPVFTTGQPFKMNSSELKKALNHTMFSISGAEIRPSLAGICLSLVGDTVSFISTDSLRLSVYSVKSAETSEKSIAITIPAKTAMELSRILPEDVEVELFFSDKQLRVMFGDVRIYSQLLQGKFPDHENFFPKKFSTKATILKKELITALKQSNLVCLKDKHKTRIIFDHEKGIEIAVEDAEVGTGSIQVVATVEGENTKVGINSTFLLEVLGVIRDDYVSVEFESPTSPIVVKGVTGGKSDDVYRHICMPIRL